ncbi:hypothetical protein AK88_01818 [Plasmodium fragile]|uniref:Uncharacterized protein n=1 Tax=Plasmodium fragile TaxID=5857 RepID=A0A0D9QNA2_PLAFR|nr:uncharacterized protein AK88_01818 [Plasmodium fragile]KJP88539.1 hypothetical protein AK88_01818 [Plasmodium fragile]
MRRIHKIFAIFLFLIVCCLIKPSTVRVHCESINDDEDAYARTLKEENFSEEFIALFDNKDVRILIEKLILEEHVKYYISNVRKSDQNIIKTIEKVLVREFPSTIGIKGEAVKNELLKFLSIIFTQKEDIVKEFFDKFNNNSFDIGVNYRHFENKFWGEYENIENLKKSYFSTFNEASESLNSTRVSEDNQSSLNFIDIQNKILSNVASLKDTLANLKSGVVSLYNINYGLNELKNEVDVYISNFRNEQQSSESAWVSTDSANAKDRDVMMLNLVEDVASKLMFNLRTKISSTRDELEKRLTTLEKELMDMCNEITQLGSEEDVLRFSIIKNDSFLNIESIRSEYEEYVNKKESGEEVVDDASDTNDTDEESVFEKNLKLLAKHSIWLKEQDPSSYCARDDISEVLKNCFNLVEKLRDQIVQENFHLLMKYEKLYKVLNKFLYQARSSSMEVSYLKAWNSIENFKGADILLNGVDKFLRIVTLLTHMIKLFKEANKNMSADVFSNLNILNDGFSNAADKVTLFKMELGELMHRPYSLQVIKNNIEKFGHVYKDNIAKMEVITNSYDIASENMHSEIDEFLKIVSNMIQADNLISEFKQLRSMWKEHVNQTLDELDEKNMLLSSAYKGNRHIVFPPEINVSRMNFLRSGGIRNSLKNIVNRSFGGTGEYSEDSISNSTLESPYFLNLYKNVMNKLDSVKEEDEMRSIFSVIYRSTDIIVEIIKDKRSQINKEYNKKRNAIINLINYRNDSRADLTNVYNKLIELEGELVNNLRILFLNKVNLNKQVDNSVEMTKVELFKDKLPQYCIVVEQFITKYFLTMARWKNLIRNNRSLFPPELISNVVE